MDAREFVDELDTLIGAMIKAHQEGMDDAREEQIEVIKRQLTDYLLETDPRKGIYVKGDHP